MLGQAPAEDHSFLGTNQSSRNGSLRVALGLTAQDRRALARLAVPGFSWYCCCYGTDTVCIHA
jgi:hypothetical protein